MILEKKMIFYEIFQVGACPNLKDSSLYDRFIIHMYKARSIRFLWLFCAICDSIMSCTIHFVLEKGDFSWNISSWCMPQLERFLILWLVFYSCVQGLKQSVPPNLLLYLRLPYAVQGTFCVKKMIFHEIFQVGACPNLKDSSLYESYSIHMYKARSILHL